MVLHVVSASSVCPRRDFRSVVLYLVNDLILRVTIVLLSLA